MGASTRPARRRGRRAELREREGSVLHGAPAASCARRAARARGGRRARAARLAPAPRSPARSP
ncbi:MAG: hypothetical protein MZV70_45525 [Desulfobacterales bacterium]|nr:hypothetical protein [Desulfobacterales bacterium]